MLIATFNFTKLTLKVGVLDIASYKHYVCGVLLVHRLPVRRLPIRRLPIRRLNKIVPAHIGRTAPNV